MTKWLFVSLVSLLVIAGASQAETTVLEDFETVGLNVYGENGTKLYWQDLDVNWATQFGTDTDPEFTISDHDDAVYHPADGDKELWRSDQDKNESARAIAIFSVDFSASSNPANWTLSFLHEHGKGAWAGDPALKKGLDDFDVWIGIDDGDNQPLDEIATDIFKNNRITLNPDIVTEEGWAHIRDNGYTLDNGVTSLPTTFSFGFNDDVADVDVNVPDDLTGYNLMVILPQMHPTEAGPWTIDDIALTTSVTEPVFISVRSGTWDAVDVDTWDEGLSVAPGTINPVIVDDSDIVTVDADGGVGKWLLITDSGAVQVDGVLAIDEYITVNAGALMTVAGGAQLDTPTLKTAGATTFASGSTANITTLTATGGTTTISPGASGAIETINVTGATLNYNGTGATNLKVTGGAVNIGAGAAVTNADFTAGAGTVNAAKPLAISSEMKLADNITATYIPGGGATSFTAGGANIADTSVVHTLTLSGGELILSVPDTESGLDIRGWQGQTGNLEGEIFSMTAPNPAVNHSTYAGTIGYATESIDMSGSDVEHFGDGENSGVPDSSLLRPSGYNDLYTVEYRGLLYIETGGDYRFATRSDEGSALWIGPSTDNPDYSTADVQNGGDHGMVTQNSGQLSLRAGYHNIIARFYEATGENGLQVLWDPTGGTSWSAIPGANFSHGSVVIDLPNTYIAVEANSTLNLGSERVATLGGIEVADSSTLTVDSDATDIQLTNLTLGGGSMVKSTAAAAANVTITVGGTFRGGDGVSSLGDSGGLENNTSLTLAAGASFEWTFTKDDAATDEWLGDLVFVNGALEMADGLDIHLVDGGGSSGVGGVDVALFQLQAGDAPFNAGQINIDAPGLDWTWGELEYYNEEWVILRGLVTGAVVAPHDGDADNDGKVDHLDLELFDQQFGLKGSGLSCDFNNDDVVGIDDLAILRANFGWVLPTAPGAGGASSPAGTPEPATMSLLALGGLMVLRRRRKA